MKVLLYVALRLCRCLPLYPTWFRWKIGRTHRRGSTIHTLYPTWFRWKSLQHRQHQQRSLSLYPTWFRWKFATHNVWPERFNLYIPHGSDESGKACRLIYSSPATFISHMVQMKVPFRSNPSTQPNAFISHMVQMKVIKAKIAEKKKRLPLYPTWFRWKQHVVKQILRQRLLTLYPTWFRWKDCSSHAQKC